MFHGAHDEQNPQMTGTFSCYVFITASGCACLHHHLSCASACKKLLSCLSIQERVQIYTPLSCKCLILLAPQQCFLGTPSSHVWNEVCCCDLAPLQCSRLPSRTRTNDGDLLEMGERILSQCSCCGTPMFECFNEGLEKALVDYCMSLCVLLCA